MLRSTVMVRVIIVYHNSCIKEGGSHGKQGY